MSAKAATLSPLDQLEQLLPKITHDELLQLVTAGQVELGRRSEQYANAVLELDPAPRDLVNEALAFVSCAGDLMPSLPDFRGVDPAITRAWHEIHDARDDLKRTLGGYSIETEFEA
jgi:hypothetical protein